jgi:RNA polymerase sigma-70 factor (ECF subfamily)
MSRTAEASDDELARAAAGGDRDALELLLARHFDYVHTVCRRVLWRKDHADALEQARQDALLRIARSIKTFSFESKLTTWIHRIATNAALDALQRFQRTPVPAEREADVRSASGSGTFEERVEQRAAIDGCLDQLPEAYRDAVVLCFLAELEYEEIADRLGIEMGTVKSRIARGRTRLQDCLTAALGERT